MFSLFKIDFKILDKFEKVLKNYFHIISQTTHMFKRYFYDVF